MFKLDCKFTFKIKIAQYSFKKNNIILLVQLIMSSFLIEPEMTVFCF